MAVTELTLREYMISCAKEYIRQKGVSVRKDMLLEEMRARISVASWSRMEIEYDAMFRDGTLLVEGYLEWWTGKPNGNMHFRIPMVMLAPWVWG
jgi:hypothetical protein